MRRCSARALQGESRIWRGTTAMTPSARSVRPIRRQHPRTPMSARLVYRQEYSLAALPIACVGDTRLRAPIEQALVRGARAHRCCVLETLPEQLHLQREFLRLQFGRAVQTEQYFKLEQILTPQLGAVFNPSSVAAGRSCVG